MKILSLFDGIACGRVALERVGIKVDEYVAYEIDKYAIQVATNNYPDIIEMGSVIDADFARYKGFDLLIGGSPCQSLSITTSNKRQNLDGKSKLFFEFARALKEVQPKYFLFENVASMNNESKQIISEYLGCYPIKIDSADFSAQTRERYYWTNIPVILFNYQKNSKILADILEDIVDEKYYYKQDYKFMGYDKTVCATLNINGHDILKRVNSPYAKCQTLTCCAGGNLQKKVLINNRVRKLTPLEYERLQTLPDNYTEGISNSQRYNCIGNGWTVDVIAWIFSFIPKEDNND